MTGSNRSIRVSTPLAPDKLVFESMTGSEMLGRPFSFEVDLLSESSEIDPGDLLGKPMTVHLDTLLGERHFNGIVTEFRVLSGEHRLARYRASLRPELWLLSYSADCRIFQKMTVPEIVERVLKNRHVTYVADGLKGTYSQREYVVQYRESDLNFVSRLMEQEGIFYYFVHDDGKHTLVLVDEVSACKPAPGYDAVPYMPPDDKNQVNIEHISKWTAGARLVPGTFSLREFRADKPKDLPTATAKTLLKAGDGSPRPGADYEVYDYPGEHKTVDEIRQEAITRLREHEAWFETAEAHGDTRGIGAGNTFKLVNLPRALQSDKSYLVVKADYALTMNAYQGAGGGGAELEYAVAYALVDSKCEYRTPSETPRPHVQGPQTATVVRRRNDPQDEEIVTDDDGRVLVKFHWDRRGEAASPPDDPADADKEQSMLIRVSQVWAGAGWGASFIPRVGHEVVVDFLEGDPDRPLITGRVYNGDNKPPYPKNPTQSGIKTRSSKGATANNFNEIRFEDKKGAEELFFQAEKDQTTKVKHNQAIAVDVDRSVTVGGNETIAVTGTRTSTITKKETETFNDEREMTVAKTDTVTVTGKHTGTYHGGREETVELGDTLTVMGSDKITTVHGQYNIAADMQVQITQGANALLIKNAVAVNSEGPITVNNPTCSVELKDGKLTVTAADEVVLQCGSASISLKKDGTIEISGSQKVQATGGGSGMELAAAGATVSGTKATMTGTAMAEITGGIVKIN